MELITRTIYGSYLQTVMLMELPYEMKPFTTLNERFDILKGVPPPATQRPAMKYWTIGNGGHRFDCAADSIPKPEPIQHRATDASCYNPIPFALVEPTQDIAAGERVKFCLRKEIQVNGRTYVAYYGRRMNLTGVTAQMQLKTVRDGVTTTTGFVANSSNLNPTPPDINSTGVNITDGNYVVATAKVTLSLTPADARLLIDMSQVMYGDPNFAIISEIALFSGVDRDVNVTSPGGGSYTFTDVIAAQVNSFVNTFFPVAYSNNGIELILDVGATEPLLKIA